MGTAQISPFARNPERSPQLSGRSEPLAQFWCETFAMAPVQTTVSGLRPAPGSGMERAGQMSPVRDLSGEERAAVSDLGIGRTGSDLGRPFGRGRSLTPRVIDDRWREVEKHRHRAQAREPLPNLLAVH